MKIRPLFSSSLGKTPVGKAPAMLVKNQNALPATTPPAPRRVHFQEEDVDAMLHSSKTIPISRKAYSDMKLAQSEVGFYLSQLRKRLKARFPMRPIGKTRELTLETLAFYNSPKAARRRQVLDEQLGDLLKGFAATQSHITPAGLRARIKTLDTHLKGTYHLVEKIRQSQGWLPRLSDQQLTHLQRSLRHYEKALQELLPKRSSPPATSQ